MKKLVCFILMTLLLSLATVANAEVKALGLFALRKSVAVDDDPMLFNHMTKYSNQSNSQYDFYHVYYNDEFYQFNYETLNGTFSVMAVRIDPNTGKNLTPNAIMTSYQISTKGAFSFTPAIHVIMDEKGKILLKKEAPLGSEILYKDSAAQLAGFMLTNRTGSSTYYPNR